MYRFAILCVALSALIIPGSANSTLTRLDSQRPPEEVPQVVDFIVDETQAKEPWIRKPLTYTEIIDAADIGEQEFNAIQQVVLRHRPFTFPADADAAGNEAIWYTPVIIQITGDKCREVTAATCFTGRLATSGNLILLRKGKGGWVIVDVGIWAK